MENRISEMEERLTQVRVANASLTTSVELLSEAVRELTKIVGDLRDTMNRGRGAVWAISGCAAVASSIVTLVAKKFVG